MITAADIAINNLAQLDSSGRLLTPFSRRARVVTVGSSLTDLNFTNTTPITGYGVNRRLNRAWFDYMQYALGAKSLDLFATFAAGGQTIAQILAQIQSALLLDADWIMGDLGVINSASAGVSLATMKTQARQCIDAIAKSGRLGMLLNPTPLASNAASNLQTATNHKLLAAVGREMAIYGRLRGILILDAAKIITDGTSSSGYAITNRLQVGSPIDGLHYANIGSRLLGTAGATLVAPFLTEYPLTPISQLDVYDATNNPNQLSTNPLMSGSVAVSGGTGITGTMPTARALSAAGATFTGTSTVTPRGDTIGNDWIVTVTAASAAGGKLFFTIEPDFSGAVTTGDELLAVSGIEITGASNLRYAWYRLTPTTTALQAGIGEDPAETHLIGEVSQADLTGGLFIAPKLIVPSGTANLRLFLELGFDSVLSTAAVTVAISRTAIIRT